MRCMDVTGTFLPTIFIHTFTHLHIKFLYSWFWYFRDYEKNKYFVFSPARALYGFNAGLYGKTNDEARATERGSFY